MAEVQDVGQCVAGDKARGRVNWSQIIKDFGIWIMLLG